MSTSRLILFYCFAVGLFSHTAFCHDDGFEIYRHINQWEQTNIWRISVQRLTNAPVWKGQEEPPLSIGRALKIAETHIAMANKATHGSCWVMEINLTQVAPMSNTGIYYYNILLGGVSYVGHFRRCIILMDGSIVEPQILGSKSNHYDPWNFDE
jgi:hypothetical protein